jgi:predicted negative regulator of RcsB-dependent stress response
MDIEDDIFAKRRGKIYFKHPLSNTQKELIIAKNFIDSGNYKIAVDSLSSMLGDIKTDDLKAEVYLDLSEANFYLGHYKESLNYAITSKLLNTNEERWIKPFACYYAAKADEKLGDTTAVQNLIDEAKSYSDYDYQKKLKNLLFALSSDE